MILYMVVRYFTRPYTIAEEDEADAEEHGAILADAISLQKFALDYSYHEIAVVTINANVR